MNRALLPAILTLFLTSGVPAATAATEEDVVVRNARLDGWVLEGSLMVGGGRDRTSYLNRLPCAEVHDAIDAYNQGALTVPAGHQGEVPSSLGHWLYDREDVSALVAALAGSGESISASMVAACTQIQQGWVPMSGAVLSAWGDPRARTIGDPQGCGVGDVLVVSELFWWDHISSGWVWSGWVGAFRGSWEDVAAVNGQPVFVWMGAVEARCLSLFPPTVDVADVVDLVPDQVVGLNPLGDGLVNLDTWMWLDFTAANSTTVGPLTTTIDRYGRAWTLTTNAWVDRAGWDMNCEWACDYRGTLDGYEAWKHETEVDFDDSPEGPALVYWAGEGTEEGALAKYRYRTKGEYVVSVATIWRGTWVFGGVVYVYPPVVVATPRPYHINEIVAVHVPN